MKTKSLSICALVIVFLVPALAHDLYLKLDTYFVQPNEKVTVKVLNGSFQASDGAVNFARLANLSVVAPDGTRSSPTENDYTKDDKTSYLHLRPTEVGNYVVGLSTMTREIDLAGKDFNEYLTEDGIPDTLEERRKRNELDKAVRERYSKHVKVIFQSGNRQTNSYKHTFGYPVEIVPVNNPYTLRTGGTFVFRCLLDGKPIPNQYVMTGRDDGTNLRIGENLRADRKGIAKLKITGPGKWYVKFIHMTRLDDPKLNYESKWASLTFEIR